MTLEEFIRARVAEDRRRAENASPPHAASWHYGSSNRAYIGQGWVHNADNVVITGDGGSGIGSVAAPIGQHMAHFDPKRILDQCAAIEELVRRANGIGDEAGSPQFSEAYAYFILTPVAAIWATHPDYMTWD